MCVVLVLVRSYSPAAARAVRAQLLGWSCGAPLGSGGVAVWWCGNGGVIMVVEVVEVVAVMVVVVVVMVDVEVVAVVVRLGSRDADGLAYASSRHSPSRPPSRGPCFLAASAVFSASAAAISGATFVLVLPIQAPMRTKASKATILA